jgi:hypothetical protein
MIAGRTWFAVVAFVAGVALALAACGSGDGKSLVKTDPAKDLAVEAGVVAVSAGVGLYLGEHGTLPAAATRDVIGQYVDPWPTNPWSHKDMTQGAGKGDYTYTPAFGGTVFTIAGHLSDGTDVVRP